MSVTRDNMPKSMRYALTSIPSIQSETILSRFDSTNGVSFSPTGANEIRIRVKAAGFLDGNKHYLQFKAKVTTADTEAAFIDGDAGCFFERVTIEANGTQVEQLDRYSLYNGIRKSYNSSLEDLMKKNIQSGGCRLGIKQGDSGATTFNDVIQDVALNSVGDEIKTLTATPANNERIYCVQLDSGLLHNTFGKALPDGLVELEFILRLKSAVGSVVTLSGTTTPTYTISDPRIYAPVYRIMNGDIMSSYNQLISSGISWTGDTYKLYVNSDTQSGGPKSLQINDRSMSLKALITAIRRSDADNTKNNFSNTGFFIKDAGNGQVNEYHYRIAGVNYPQSQIKVKADTANQDIGRVYEEAVKALSRHGEKYSNSLVSKEQFVSQAYTMGATAIATNNLEVAKGLLCVDLRKFDDKELRMVGLMTANNAAPSTLEYTCDAGWQTALDVSTFAIVEAVWTMDPTGALRVAM